MPASMQGSGEALSNQRAQKAIESAENRAGDMAGTLDQQPVAIERGLMYRTLQTKHPEYDAGHWELLHALYRGGKEVTYPSPLQRKLIPEHRDEYEAVYDQRLRCAFYTPYAGEIVDHIVSALCSQDILLELGDNAEPPEFYQEFFRDVSPSGGQRQSLNEFLRYQVLHALIFRRVWTLVELPPAIDVMGNHLEFDSLSEQEQSGALRAYVVAIHPAAVLDWEEDESGELIWANCHSIVKRRESIMDTREFITERWMVYTRETWSRYEIRYHVKHPPKPTAIVPLVAEGAHTVGHVPLISLELPHGLWAMQKLQGLATEHYNKRSALAWAEKQSLFPEFFEFLGPEDSEDVSEAQENSDRWRDRRGPGFVHVRGKDDRAEFVGPETSGFAHARQSCMDIRDEMHRVVHQMALSVDNSAAALGRSADSKAEDKAATAVVLTDLGKRNRYHAENIYHYVSAARSEMDIAHQWQASGQEKFDSVHVGEATEQALNVQQLDIQSPTFQQVYLFTLAKMILGDAASDEELEAIRRELEQMISAEQMTSVVDKHSADIEDLKARLERDDDDDDGVLGPPRD